MRPSFEHPLLGDTGGLNIVFGPELQGRGLGKAAYLHMLERMPALGLDRMHGMTSNPAVIHIGRQLGRRLRRVLLRRDGPFLSPDALAVD